MISCFLIALSSRCLEFSDSYWSVVFLFVNAKGIAKKQCMLFSTDFAGLRRLNSKLAAIDALAAEYAGSGSLCDTNVRN